MKIDFTILLGATLMVLIAPVVAESPFDAIYSYSGIYREPSMVEPFTDNSVTDPMDSIYVQSNLPVIDLSGVNPEIFRNAAFAKDPGGLSSGNLYTSNIYKFLNADSDAGASKVTKKAAKIGLVQWLGIA